MLLCYPAGLEFIAVFFGCLVGGFIAVPLPITYLHRKDSVLPALIHATGARAVLTDDSTSSLPSRAWTQQIENFVWTVTNEDIPRTALEVLPDPSTPETIAYLQFTSGSTRFPRGVTISHGNVLSNLAAIDETFLHDDSSLQVSWLPQFHDMGLVYGILQPVVHGFPCYLISPQKFIEKPGRWLAAISRLKATHSGGPNFAYDLCVRKISEEEVSALDLSSWRIAFNGAEPVRELTIENFCSYFGAAGFRRTAMIPAYGLAEATLKVTAGTAGTTPRFWQSDGQVTGRERPRLLTSCGQPAAGTRVLIVDINSQEILEEDRIGEVWVSGPGVAKGYWNSPSESAEVFGCHPANQLGEDTFLRTGDLGIIHNRELYIYGRIKDLIIINGRNYSPADLEADSATAHPATSGLAGAAFAVERETCQIVIVAQEISVGREKSYSNIAAAIQRQVSLRNDLIVDEVVLLRTGTLPRTTSGKVRRLECRQAYEEGRLLALASFRVGDLGIADNPPEPLDNKYGSFFAHLRRIAAATLEIGESAIQPHGAPLQMGMTSLRAADMSGRIGSELGISVSPADIIAASNWAEVAEKIAHGERTRSSWRLRSKTGDRIPATSEQERLWMLGRKQDRCGVLHLTVEAELRGRLSTSSLDQAVRGLLDYHRILCAHFELEKGRLVQISGEPPATPLKFTHADLSNSQSKQGPLLMAGRSEPEPALDVTKGKLFNLVLERRSVAHHYLLLTVHHLVCDAYSLLLILQELLKRYKAAIEELEYLASPDAAPFFLTFGRNGIRPNPIEAARYLELQCPEGVAAYLPLEADRDRSEASRNALENLRFTPDTWERVNQKACECGATPFQVLMTTFQIFIGRVFGLQKFLIAFPVSGRDNYATLQTIGPCAYPKVLAADLSDAPLFSSLLRRVQKRLTAATMQNVSFLEILKFLGAVHSISQQIAVPFFFNLIGDPGVETGVPDLKISYTLHFPAMQDFKVALSFITSPTSTAGVIESCEILGWEASDLANGYLQVLEKCLAEPKLSPGNELVLSTKF